MALLKHLAYIKRTLVQTPQNSHKCLVHIVAYLDFKPGKVTSGDSPKQAG